MLAYLLKSGGCLMAFYFFYKFFLEKENMHVYKRIYLLAIIALSFIIPLVTFTNYVAIVEQTQAVLNTNTVAILPAINETEQQLNWTIILWTIYGIGALLFGVKFIKNCVDIIKKIKSNQQEKLENTTAVLLNEDIAPHTFFNFIFYNKKKYISGQIPKEVIEHEKTHAHQKHSIDVILLELLQIVFWFNPMLYLIKKAVKLNHEFLADQAVLNKGTNTKAYQQTLLAYSSNAYQLPPTTIGMAHAINYSSIKKRFTVMKTHTSKKKIWIKSFILLPIFALLLFSFSTTVQQEKASPKQIAEYNTLAKKYNSQPKNSRVVKLKDLNRLEYLYKLMTPAQKKQAETFPECPPPPPAQKNTMRLTKSFYTYKNNNGDDVKVELQYDGHKDFYSVPPPPPIPENATEKQKATYAKAIEKYNQKIADEKQMLDKFDKKTKDESNRPITLVNGKSQCDGCVLELTKSKLAAIVLSVDKGEILNFKIKFPKKPTVTVNNSNTLNRKAKTFLKEAEVGQMVQIFGLKSSVFKSHSAPVIFKIIK